MAFMGMECGLWIGAVDSVRYFGENGIEAMALDLSAVISRTRNQLLFIMSVLRLRARRRRVWQTPPLLIYSIRVLELNYAKPIRRLGQGVSCVAAVPFCVTLISGTSVPEGIATKEKPPRPDRQCLFTAQTAQRREPRRDREPDRFPECASALGLNFRTGSMVFGRALGTSTSGQPS
jgi:hypothetical protein